MRWAASVNLDFRIPGGYFLAPRNGNSGDPGKFGGRPTSIAQLFDQVATTGRAVKLTEQERRRALDELRYWHAAILVLPVRHPNVDSLRRTVEDLVGPGRQVSDVWMWDVRALTGRTA
jgi:hypothetical protein